MCSLYFSIPFPKMFFFSINWAKVGHVSPCVDDEVTWSLNYNRPYTETIETKALIAYL